MIERTIILDGFSKTYAMTGWRLGYGVMPEELIPHVTRLVTNSVFLHRYVRPRGWHHGVEPDAPGRPTKCFRNSGAAARQ